MSSPRYPHFSIHSAPPSSFPSPSTIYETVSFSHQRLLTALYYLQKERTDAKRPLAGSLSDLLSSHPLAPTLRSFCTTLPGSPTLDSCISVTSESISFTVPDSHGTLFLTPLY